MRLGLIVGVANEALLAFPCHGIYVDLVHIEPSALKPDDCNLCKFAIIGSGPLPLTSLCISDHLNKKDDSIIYHNIDQNSMAISLSKALCSALGHTKKTVGFECADAQCRDRLELLRCCLPGRMYVTDSVSILSPFDLSASRKTYYKTICSPHAWRVKFLP